MTISRRSFLKRAATIPLATVPDSFAEAAENQDSSEKADYTIRIATGLVELSPAHIVSTTLYNGQFPGPLVRLTEGKQVVVDIYTTPARRSSSTGMASSFQLMLTAPPRRARHTFRRTACAASPLCRSHRVSASITLTSFP
jgi:hypothetical protein